MPTDFEAAVEDFVESSLKGYEPSTPPARRKAIHDALWGTIILSPAEIALLRLPITPTLALYSPDGFCFLCLPLRESL